MNIILSISYRMSPNQPRKAADILELYLHMAGFSVGTRQAGAPRGIMLGDYSISKWRNLNADERAALHGTMRISACRQEALVAIFNTVTDHPDAKKIINNLLETPPPRTLGTITYSIHEGLDLSLLEIPKHDRAPMRNGTQTLHDDLIHEAVKHWHTSIVESGNDFNRMKSTLTAIMPRLIEGAKPADAEAGR